MGNGSTGSGWRPTARNSTAFIYEDLGTKVLRTPEKVYQVGRKMLLFLVKRWCGVFSVDAVLIRSNPEKAPSPAITACCYV